MIGDGPHATVALVGGDREGVYDVYGPLEPEELEDIYPGYKLKWVKRDWDDWRDPLAHLEWIAKLVWQDG